MTIDPRLARSTGEATNEYLHSVLLNCGLGDSLARRVGAEVAGQLAPLIKGDPIAFEELEVGDTIRTVHDWDGMTEQRVGTVSKITGHTAYYQQQQSGADRLLTISPTEDPIDLYLLHRPEKPKPLQLADLQPGLVLDNRGDSWVFDGAYAYRGPLRGTASRVPVDEGRDLAPWSQAATLDYSTDGQPAPTPDLAEAAGKRTEYGIRYPDGEVTLRPTAREAVADAKKRGRALGPRHAVEPVTRTNWGTAESAWAPIEVAEEAPPATEPFKWGTKDPDGQRIYIGKTPDGTMHLGIGLASARLRGSMAVDLAKALTDMAGEA